MKLIVVSKNDTASLNIAENLLVMEEWGDEGEFNGNPIRRFNDFVMATINDEHLSHDGLDRELREDSGIEPEVMIFASRHKSASALKSFTVHTPGNFTKAEMGGKTGELVPASPRYKTFALRRLKELGEGMEHTVSYEATHHGPYLETPAFYIEIGSDETCWIEKEAGRIIAEVILSLDASEDPVAIGVGGGHYAPRHTDVALKNKVCFGHIIANYALESITEEMLDKAIDRTPDVEYVYFHRKAMRKSQYRELKDWFEDRGLKTVSQKDIPSRS